MTQMLHCAVLRLNAVSFQRKGSIIKEGCTKSSLERWVGLGKDLFILGDQHILRQERTC